jgi:ubiquinone/menaquinone biosynthesis C-methylase UbiE
MIGKGAYRTGEYVEHFRPDDTRNPLRALYAAKQADVVASVRSDLVPGCTVLDLGGGPGRMAVSLAGSYRVTLCDVSADMLQISEKAARERQVPSGNLVLRQLDAEEPLPFEPASFDRALCIDLLVHLSDPLPTLRELRRVLKPAGQLLVDVSNASPWWLLRYPRSLGRRPGGWLRTWRTGGVPPEWQTTVRHYRYDEYRELLDRSDLRIVQEWRYGPRWCPAWFLSMCVGASERR